MFTGTVSDAKFLITTPLLYRPPRLQYFFDMVRCLWEFSADLVDLRIITSTFKDAEKAAVLELLKPFHSPHFRISIESFWNKDDPKDLTWVHKRLITDTFLVSREFTHFIYLEDDIRMSRRNVEYFIADRPLLAAAGFIPSFVRYEFNATTRKLYASDVITSVKIPENALRAGGKTYLMANNPYCASYILDQALAREYAASSSFDKETSAAVWGWPSTERSAMGLCFENPPAGSIARFLIPVDTANRLPDARCLIHHLPNNFTNADWPAGHHAFGKTEILHMFSEN